MKSIFFDKSNSYLITLPSQFKKQKKGETTERVAMRRCLKIKVLGKVQGVFYRDFVQKSAVKLNIEGTVQNSDDGAVMIFACGETEKLDALIDELYKGSPKSKVENIVVEPLQLSKDFRGVFRIIGENH